MEELMDFNRHRGRAGPSATAHTCCMCFVTQWKILRRGSGCSRCMLLLPWLTWLNTVPVDVTRPSDVLNEYNSISSTETKYNIQLTTRDNLINNYKSSIATLQHTMQSAELMQVITTLIIEKSKVTINTAYLHSLIIAEHVTATKIKLTYVGFRAHVKIASRIVS